MKKVLALAVLAALTMSAFGQGQLTFNNRVPTATPPISAPVYLADGVTLATGTAARAALLGGGTSLVGAVIPASGDVNAASMGTLNLLASPNTPFATWVTFRTGTFAGFVAVGTDSARDSGLAYGSQGNFQMVAWTGDYTTWADAFNAWKNGTPGVTIGASAVIPLTVTLSAVDLNVPVLTGLQSFKLIAPGVVPEPTSFALLGLGAASMLIFRRRK